jgi:hypothetical protein
MIESLRSDIASPEHGDAAVRLEGVVWNGNDVELKLSVTDHHGDVVHSEWVVRCCGVRECVVLGRFGDLVVHEASHAVIRQHRDPRRALFFTGKAGDVDALIGRLWRTHRALAGSWIAFERYLNAERPLRDLLSFGSGKLADGPDFLIQGYARALTEASVEVSLGDAWPTTVWTGVEWIETAAELAMLAIDTSFVVAERFEDERTGKGAG